MNEENEKDKLKKAKRNAKDRERRRLQRERYEKTAKRWKQKAQRFKQQVNRGRPILDLEEDAIEKISLIQYTTRPYKPRVPTAPSVIDLGLEPKFAFGREYYNYLLSPKRLAKMKKRNAQRAASYRRCIAGDVD